MKLSILPVYVMIIFAFCTLITLRARRHQSIETTEARSVYFLLLTLFGWTLVIIGLGVRGIHASSSLLKSVPLLWQSFVPILIVVIYLLFSRNLAQALRGIVSGTPWHWLILIHGLRIGALGGVVKGIKGEVTSSFVFWVGIPDFLYGVSALVVGWLWLREAVDNRLLIIWNLIGAAIILLPTFLPMNYWMNEPGFIFIFEFPMILAPGIVIPILVLLNFMLAWGARERYHSGTQVTPVEESTTQS